MTIMELKRNMRQARRDEIWYTYNGIVTCDAGRDANVNIRVFEYCLKKFDVNGIDHSTNDGLKGIRLVEEHIARLINEATQFDCDECGQDCDEVYTVGDRYLCEICAGPAAYSYTVSGSHGHLTVDGDGFVTGCFPDGDDDEYKIINRVDLVEWRRWWKRDFPVEFDILDLGYWEVGSYIGPEMDWRKRIMADVDPFTEIPHNYRELYEARMSAQK